MHVQWHRQYLVDTIGFSIHDTEDIWQIVCGFESCKEGGLDWYFRGLHSHVPLLVHIAHWSRVDLAVERGSHTFIARQSKTASASTQPVLHMR